MRLDLVHFVNAKFPHAEWCELETGLWHECDCGASEERMRIWGIIHAKERRLNCTKTTNEITERLCKG